MTHSYMCRACSMRARWLVRFSTFMFVTWLSRAVKHLWRGVDFLQHCAPFCNVLQHTATHCNTLQYAATRCNTLQHAATRCNTLQHAARHHVQFMVCVELYVRSSMSMTRPCVDACRDQFCLTPLLFFPPHFFLGDGQSNTVHIDRLQHSTPGGEWFYVSPPPTCPPIHPLPRNGLVCAVPFRAHSYVWRDSFTCGIRLTYLCDMTHSCIWYDSFISVIWPIYVWDMSHSYVWRIRFICVTWLIMCDVSCSCAWLASFICVPWLIHMRDMTNSYTWHDHSYVDMTHSCRRYYLFICMIWLSMCVIHSHAWHDSFDDCSPEPWS